MLAEHYENSTMLSRVTAKNVGVFFETQCSILFYSNMYRFDISPFVSELTWLQRMTLDSCTVRIWQQK